jgi:hypothetical protein
LQQALDGDKVAEQQQQQQQEDGAMRLVVISASADRFISVWKVF